MNKQYWHVLIDEMS